MAKEWGKKRSTWFDDTQPEAAEGRTGEHSDSRKLEIDANQKEEFQSHSWTHVKKPKLLSALVAGSISAGVVAEQHQATSSSASKGCKVWPYQLPHPKKTKVSAEPEPSANSSSNQIPEEAKQKWQSNIKDNFINNKWSGHAAASIAADAQRAGAQGSEKFAKVEGHFKNAARDMLRACLKDCCVPELYYFKCRVKNKDTGQTEVVNMPCLPPHENLIAILEKATPEQKAKWLRHPTRQADVDSFCAEFGTDANITYPIGLHGDGVPFKAKMADSIEQFSWSFASDPSSPRILFCVVPKSFCAGRDTYEDILAAFAASLKVSATGQHATQRLDGEPWQKPSDVQRSKQKGPLPYVACLIELRGDWAYYNQVFGFPSWASTRMCWKCGATQHGHCSFRDTGPDACWRTLRQTCDEFLQHQLATGVANSVIFTAPGVKISYVVIDWLHTMDLGLCQTILGNTMFECLAFLEGNTQAAKAATLWGKVKEYYKEARPATQFQKITLDMIRLQGKGPKLRGKAAETRHLVPFVQRLAREFAGKSKHCTLVAEVVDHLSMLYMCLDATPFPAAFVAQECQQMCDKFVALNLEASHFGRDKHWKIKPKLHLLQELLEYDCLRTGQSPRLFWTYTDEHWGGVIAQIAERRGGPRNAAAIGVTVMQRYRAFVHE